MHLPVAVGDFVDFNGSIHHATNMGRLLRPGSEPLPPHWRRLPPAYHGRAGSIVATGTPIVRPHGQVPGADGGSPWCGARRALDFEAEVGFVVGVANEPGTAGAAVRLRRPRRRPGAGERLERPRHPGARVPAPGPVPRQVVRHVDVALAGDPRGAGALPAGRPGPGPARRPLPDRAGPAGLRHPPGGDDPEPPDAGRRPARRHRHPHLASPSSTGRSRSCWPTPPSTAPPSAPATCSPPARCRGPDPAPRAA